MRVTLGVAFLAAIFVVVSRTGAQIELPSEDGSRRSQSKEKGRPRALNFDIRLSGANNLERLLEKRVSQKSKAEITQEAVFNGSKIKDGFERLRAKQSKVEIEGSILTGAVEIVRNPDGLTKAAPGRKGKEIVREFISGNKNLYGLEAAEIADLDFISESVSADSGLRMVRVKQMVNNRPVFQSETRFILDGEGRLVESLGLMIPRAGKNAESLNNLLSPQEALMKTMAELDVPVEAEQMVVSESESDGMRIEMKVANPRIQGKVTSEIVYFPLAPGVLVPAWSQIVFGDTADWYVLADARDGTTLWRKNIRSHVSTHDARFRVYVQADGVTPADSPAPQSPAMVTPGSGLQFGGITPTIVSMLLAQNAIASPNGWINDCPGGVCTANETQTIGNNVLACMDRSAPLNVCDTDANSVLDGNGRPIGNPDTNGRNRDFLGTAPRDFESGFLPSPQTGDPEIGQTPTGNGTAQTSFRRGSVTQQFYVSNWYHDKLYLLGFDEAAGNFQLTNFSGMGLGNDRVLIDVQDASGTNNANFATPPDGNPGRAQMFRFTGPTVDRDGGLDTEILIHELTHGTSNRLVGNADGLQWDIGSGLGEGWSDFYALALLNNTNADDPNATYASGGYATYKLISGYTDNYLYGIRRFPYSTNNSVNPLTWADVDQSTNNLSGGIATSPVNFNGGGALEVHNSGELWTNTLWEVRSRIIAANANDVPTGNQKTLQIVTDGMKMTPLNPTFTQARDALVNADCAANACANEESIWNGFADRGLGYGASAPISVQLGFIAGHIGIKESFSSPNLDVNTVAINDTAGNNTGFIDPNETVNVNVNLKNPWRNASKTATGVTATISSSSPGVTIVNGSTTFPNIAPNSNANFNGGNLVVKAPASATCGANLSFTLTISSSLGSVTRDFSFRLGQPSGTLAPVTYTRNSLGLAIPDNTGAGVKDSMTIADDYEIADIDVRINSLTHTFVDDISFGVRGPSGYGSDFLSLFGLTSADGGSGDNFVNTVIDDEAVNDMFSEVAASAPFTKSYFPIFNSPQWASPGVYGATPDSVPQLSRFDGTSTLGVWTAVVSDQFGGDTGTFQGWSLIVTPRAFVCTAVVVNAPPTIMSGTVTRQQAAGVANPIIAKVDDAEDAENTLSVTVNGGASATVNGVTVSNITVMANGNVRANVEAACGATNATFTLKVTDSGGLMATATLTVNVTPETTPPVINPASYSNITVQLPANSNATSVVVNYPAPTATDNCGAVTVMTTPASGSTFPVGTTTVTIKATDAAGNMSTATFTVTVQYRFKYYYNSQLLDPAQMPYFIDAAAGSNVSVSYSLSGYKGANPYSQPPRSQRINCINKAPIGASSAISTFAYDPFYNSSYDFYTTIWRTQANYAGTCRRLTLYFNDGTTQSLDYRF